jgi:hypothetical protein
LELLRDPIRLGFALFGTAFLMLVLNGAEIDHLRHFVINVDVMNLQTFLSRRMIGDRAVESSFA